MKALALLVTLAGCAIPSPMGTLIYCPQGHVCKTETAPAEGTLKQLIKKAEGQKKAPNDTDIDPPENGRRSQ
jgi:hypothetical protein